MTDFVSIGKANDFKNGEVKKVTLDGKEIGVAKVGDDFFAFQDICTHDEGPLAQGTLEGEVIECPRHGAKFSIRTGEVLCMPASHPIETYAVKVEGDEVKVCRDARRSKA